jgi:hypothetical protein
MSHADAVRSHAIFRGTLAVAALVLSAPAFTQSTIGPRPSPPPSYGAPTAPAIVGYESSTFSTHGISFTLDVPLADVQNFVPVGYTVLAPPGSTTATVTGILSLQSQLTLQAPVGGFAAGTYGPYESLGLVVVTLAPSGFIEIVSLASLVNNSEIADIQNALQGVGSARLADINVVARPGGFSWNAEVFGKSS